MSRMTRSLERSAISEDVQYFSSLDKVLGSTLQNCKPESHYIYRGNKISASVQRSTDYWLKNNGVDVSGEWEKTKEGFVSDQQRRQVLLRKYVTEVEAVRIEESYKALRKEAVANEAAAERFRIAKEIADRKAKAVANMNICWEPITFVFGDEEYELKVPGYLPKSSLFGTLTFMERN